MKFRFIASAIAAAALSVPSFACTSVIISGKATASGRPVMMKHRDTGKLDNRIERFKGEKYDFIALVNSSSPGGEAWTGTNTVGFSIMNTATYDLKDDDVPAEMMDKEGVFMYRALSICSNLADFETYLDTLARPMGVEANFGVIDAQGGASYYEVNNHSWTKFDVNQIPCGYRVVTNFTQTGRPEDRKGVDRYEIASAVMASADVSHIDHRFLFDKISRSGKPILRDITSASIVIEGVVPGENPLHTVMWTVLGHPSSSVSVPLLVGTEDHLPSFVKSSSGSNNSVICDNALKLKWSDLQFPISSVENTADSLFGSIYSKWTGSSCSDKNFFKKYDKAMKKVWKSYLANFDSYMR